MYPPVKNKASYVLHGHLWQLVGEDILQSDKPQHGLLGDALGQRVSHQEEFNGAACFLLLGHLVPWPPQ